MFVWTIINYIINIIIGIVRDCVICQYSIIRVFKLHEMKIDLLNVKVMSVNVRNIRHKSSYNWIGYPIRVTKLPNENKQYSISKIHVRRETVNPVEFVERTTNCMTNWFDGSIGVFGFLTHSNFFFIRPCKDMVFIYEDFTKRSGKTAPEDSRRVNLSPAKRTKRNRNEGNDKRLWKNETFMRCNNTAVQCARVCVRMCVRVARASVNVLIERKIMSTYPSPTRTLQS